MNPTPDSFVPVNPLAADQRERVENFSAAFLNITKLAGFTQETFSACLNDKELQQKIVAAQKRGQKMVCVDATRTFFVNGDKYAGLLPANQMSAMIESML
ncbi:thioredoxin domain-containing protein [Aurantimonas sp. DM33-3]|uniref:thioredoxin domain-containing protein n=1 Tax=Aurantimonas sp. DM33-3 TaxID=2766955 RepID=UPI001651EFC0|nr:thioredoxin domain-containing protein [Aurantimonas sp. DM33-3]